MSDVRFIDKYPRLRTQSGLLSEIHEFIYPRPDFRCILTLSNHRLTTFAFGVTYWMSRTANV